MEKTDKRRKDQNLATIHQNNSMLVISTFLFIKPKGYLAERMERTLNLKSNGTYVASWIRGGGGAKGVEVGRCQCLDKNNIWIYD